MEAFSALEASLRATGEGKLLADLYGERVLRASSSRSASAHGSTMLACWRRRRGR